MPVTEQVLRLIACGLASVAVVLQIVTVLGPRGTRLERQSRIKAAVGVPVLVAVDYGTFYALHHDFPLNAALWLMGPALFLFDLVYVLYLVTDFRRHNGRP